MVTPIKSLNVIEATWVCDAIDEIKFNPFESIIVALIVSTPQYSKVNDDIDDPSQIV